jgi:hypothetical protein
MRRWDLLAAGLLFGIPSTLLFIDLLPGGSNRMVEMIRRIVFPERK